MNQLVMKSLFSFQIIEGIVQLLKKGETVSKGLRRLGGSDSNKNKKKSRSWQREKVYDLEMEDNETGVHFNLVCFFRTSNVVFIKVD